MAGLLFTWQLKKAKLRWWDYWLMLRHRSTYRLRYTIYNYWSTDFTFSHTHNRENYVRECCVQVLSVHMLTFEECLNGGTPLTPIHVPVVYRDVLKWQSTLNPLHVGLHRVIAMNIRWCMLYPHSHPTDTNTRKIEMFFFGQRDRLTMSHYYKHILVEYFTLRVKCKCTWNSTVE